MNESSERYTITLIEREDGALASRVTGNPPPATVIGLLESFRAIERMKLLTAVRCAQEREEKRVRAKKPTRHTGRK